LSRYFEHWNFFSNFGTRFAYGNSGVNLGSRTGKTAVTARRIKRQAFNAKSITMNAKSVELNEERCLALRKLAHELSNVTTGMLMAAGLLRESLAGDARCHYCEQINEAGERTAALVREVRALLQAEG
jgi:nitrogen-specific signal transduction histidine kinase